MWKHYIIIAEIAAIILLLFVVPYSSRPRISQPAGEPLLAKFFEKKSFYDGLPVEGAIKNDTPFVGGIIPHHLIAGSIISDLFVRLARQNPRKIILIGPNHYEIGNALVISSRKDWKTVFGNVTADREILDDLYQRNLIFFNDKVMVEEHSTQGSMPYIAYFIPEAKVVPLILSGLITKQELETLADALEKSVRAGAIVVAPVDFSHHLTADEASKRDKITLEVIKTKDIDRLLKLKSQYTDSAASIALLIMLMEKTGHGTFTLNYHTNSGELLGDRSQEVTSYIAGTFR